MKMQVFFMKKSEYFSHFLTSDYSAKNTLKNQVKPFKKLVSSYYIYSKTEKTLLSRSKGKQGILLF